MYQEYNTVTRDTLVAFLVECCFFELSLEIILITDELPYEHKIRWNNYVQAGNGNYMFTL